MANTVPITSKPKADAIQENATLLGVQENANGTSALYQFPVQTIKQAMRNTPTLLDAFTIAEGEEPVAFYQLSLSNQNWSKILIVGTIQSDDTSSVKRQLNIGTGTGFHYCRPPAEDFSAVKNFSIDAERMANGYLRARTSISMHTYTNGTNYENPGRKPITDYGKINGVYLSIISAQFAAGTSFEVWGVE